jgi:putative lipoic acid-binding regulatory protein
MSGGGKGARPPEGPSGPLLEYPVDYPFKAIGLAAVDLQAHVVALVARAVPDVEVGEVTSRPSSGGKYLAVTVNVRLRTEDERLAVYRALAADPRLVHHM